MSLEYLPNDWRSFAGGKIWRCRKPDLMIEVGREGHAPDYMRYTSSVAAVRRVRAFYARRVQTAGMGPNGNGLDILTANAMCESYGTVPTPFSESALKRVYDQAPGDHRSKLKALVDHIKRRKKYLIRKEPGYVDPVSTPNRISIGAHHVLISTALELINVPRSTTKQKLNAAILDLIIKVNASSPYAADLAMRYFKRGQGRHRWELPLVAASYNAGSPRRSSRNDWHLVQYGEHIDRWVGYYNTSRIVAAESRKGQMAAADTARNSPLAESTGALEMKVVRKEFTSRSTIGELYLNEQFYCYTLEDTVRPAGVKVYGETAIPAGRYEVKVTYSPRFKQQMPLLLNVPMFKGIRIHTGNKPEHSHGCLLVGLTKAADFVGNSRKAYTPLLQRLQRELRSGKCYITIKNS